MKVEIQPDVRDTAARLGAGAIYALKVLAGRLVDDPDMGRPSPLPGILHVTVDGTTFEDCPDLSIGYIREPDRIEIRFLRADPTAEHSPSPRNPGDEQGPDQNRPADPVAAPAADPAAVAVTVRQVADAWQRITRRLRSNAPDSYAALRAGARPSAVAALEDALGVRIPVELHVLWLLTEGDEGADGWGWGCLPGGATLMPLDAVAARHRLMMDAQAHQETLDAELPEDDRVTVWRATWIPLISRSAADRTSGLYLDTATGYLGRWSLYHEPPGDELDTLVTYLEETADMLEAPALATRDEPGLIGGALVWRSSVSGPLRDQWRPLTD
ncbi:hypothetical protein RM704_01115 [Streptomyces sp. DSM 3412]|uniref:Knr4/Smi1-like domain-containing protein n=1 Tax=Streptomyces gottesmaniae TaxID=3075518 RepID=A0ABU2YP41_9ACTN|nr:hypothetical protein [Streptomyces sp. DSM 3412]MDT0566098.1 hypothetical protein [Streptomyces sp. DSM 3412]